ncbi:MAG: HAMP domain-containing protein [Deltaproteobacteria bacterium]|nr:HAMP domain-containing protein [Deltaproteobacteria bacterium]
MIRTFARFAIVLVALLVGSASVWSLLVEPAVEQDAERSLRSVLHPPVSAAARALAEASAGKRESTRLQWERNLGMPLALREHAGPPPGEIWLVLDPELHVLASIDPSTTLRVGPVPNPPWDAVDASIRTSTYVDLVFVVIASAVLTIPLFLGLRRLRRAADRIAAGDGAARSGLTGRDELGRVGARFDAMADAVERAMEAQRELMQAVSHEFRTPLARLRFLVDEIGTEAVDGGAVRQEMERDLTELDELVDEMLTYARLEHGGPEPMSSAYVPDVIDAVVSAVAGPSTPVQIAGGPSVAAAVPARDLARAVRNLLINAQRHASAQVVVRWSREADVVSIVVDDDGEGVEPAEREAIFEPFFRGPRGGHGLGLALVRRIAERSGCVVTVDDAPLGGARFSLRLPTRTGSSA